MRRLAPPPGRTTARAVLAAAVLAGASCPGLVRPAAAAAVVQGGGDSLGANWGLQQGEVRDKVRSGQLVPLGQVVEAVRRRMPGRLLNAGLEQDGGGRPVYRVRWAAADGRRVDVIADAASGQVLREEGR